MLDNSPYWTKQRRELVRWLDDRAPSFAVGYVGAVRLLYTQSFPGRVHLVCHVVRDIYWQLPVALGDAVLPRPAEVLLPMVKTLVERWEQFPPSESPAPDRLASDIPVSPQVHRAARRLVDKSRELAKQPSVGSRLAVALFRSVDRRSDEFIHSWIINSFDDEYKFFVSRAHLVRTLERVPTDDGLIEHFEGFERGFHSLVGPYFTGKEELDAILRETNDATD